LLTLNPTFCTGNPGDIIFQIDFSFDFSLIIFISVSSSKLIIFSLSEGNSIHSIKYSNIYLIEKIVENAGFSIIILQIITVREELDKNPNCPP